MKIIFPLIGVIGFQIESKRWPYPIGLDATALHITAFATEEFITRILRHQENSSSVVAMLHFQKGTQLLRERLLGEDNELKVSDSTISVILKLTSIAHFNGDYEAAKHHMGGLRKMVNMRGGLNIFKDTMFLMEILR